MVNFEQPEHERRHKSRRRTGAHREWHSENKGKPSLHYPSKQTARWVPQSYSTQSHPKLLADLLSHLLRAIAQPSSCKYPKGFRGGGGSGSARSLEHVKALGLLMMLQMRGWPWACFDTDVKGWLCVRETCPFFSASFCCCV